MYLLIFSRLLRWYFGDMHRSEAMKLLLQPQNPGGAFLIRISSISQSLVLSLRDNDTVKHYKIHQLDNYNYYIKRTLTFHSIQEFVTHYKEDAGGLAQQLSDPCIRPVSYKDEWEIDRKTLQFNKKLGVGNFSEVWSGLWKNSIPVAIKTLKLEKVDFVAKIEIMKKIYHPNLLKLYAVCTLEEPILIVTELMQHGALLDYLRKGAGLNLKLPQLIDMAAQIAGGMAYLEEHSYIHRDLAARNVLVGNRNLCKVSDFNIACVNKEDIYNPHEGTKFPVKWTAPEAALYNRFSIKSDIWSFGIVICELLTCGAMPYPGMNNLQVLEAVERGYRMPPPDNCPDAIYNIMLSCWKDEADNRPTFEHLKYQLEDYFVSAAEGAYKPVE